MNSLVQLEQFGQAFWLDYIRRNFIAAGDLDRLVASDELKGVTSSPSIFEKAIAGSTDYQSQIEGFRCENSDPQRIFEALAVRDIQGAAEEHENVLENIRLRVRNTRRVATCLDFGPRFLHSTGQAYKGGPNSGVFPRIACNDPQDLAIPGQNYTFGVVKAAQALGDLQMLQERHRRALRLHVAGDLSFGLTKLHAAVKAPLSA